MKLLAIFRNMCNPLDAVPWKEFIIDYASKTSVRALAQRENMREFKPTTWPEHFAKVENFIKDLGLV